MDLLKLLGIVIVIVGFVMKMDSILIIMAAAIVTALVSGMDLVTFLETLGSSFVSNRSWFFGQVLFVGTSGMLLVQSTLADLGYEVELIDLTMVQIPVALCAVGIAIVYYYLKDRQLSKKRQKAGEA